LAYCYEFGIGTKKNESKASKWYETSASLGNDVAIGRLGLYFLDEKDYEEAFDCFQVSAKRGNLKSTYYLAKCYQNGYGCPVNEVLAYKLFKIIAGEGDYESLYEVAICKLYGIGTTKNEREAFNYFVACKEQGIELASDAIACCMLNGIGTAKNEEGAIELFKFGARNDWALSCYNLSLCYALGKGIEKDESKALELLTKSAELEYGEAQYYLGKCYEFANFVDADYKKAKYWYLRSSKTYPLAEVALADLVFDGHGVSASYLKANKMYKKIYESKKLKEAGIGYGVTCLFLRGKERTGVDVLKSLYDVNSFEINEFLGWCF